DIPITSGVRLTIAPKEKSQNAGLSITLTGTPAARAADANAAASSSSLKAPTATAAPFKSWAVHARVSILIAPRGGLLTTWARPPPEVGRMAVDTGAGRRKHLCFPGCRRTPSRQHGPLAFKRQKYWQPRQSIHARKRCFGRSSMIVHRHGLLIHVDLVAVILF